MRASLNIVKEAVGMSLATQLVSLFLTLVNLTSYYSKMSLFYYDVKNSIPKCALTRVQSCRHGRLKGGGLKHPAKFLVAISTIIIKPRCGSNLQYKHVN